MLSVKPVFITSVQLTKPVLAVEGKYVIHSWGEAQRTQYLLRLLLALLPPEK